MDDLGSVGQGANYDQAVKSLISFCSLLIKIDEIDYIVPMVYFRHRSPASDD